MKTFNDLFAVYFNVLTKTGTEFLIVLKYLFWIYKVRIVTTLFSM